MNDIIVRGPSGWQHCWAGLMTKISPEAPVPVVKVGSSSEKIAGAAALALYLQSRSEGVGRKTLLETNLYADAPGQRLAKALSAEGVDFSLSTMRSENCPSFLSVVSRDQPVIKLSFDDEKEEGFFDHRSTTNHETCGRRCRLAVSYSGGGFLCSVNLNFLFDSIKENRSANLCGPFLSLDGEKLPFVSYYFCAGSASQLLVGGDVDADMLEKTARRLDRRMREECLSVEGVQVMSAACSSEELLDEGKVFSLLNDKYVSFLA